MDQDHLSEHNIENDFTVKSKPGVADDMPNTRLKRSLINRSRKTIITSIIATIAIIFILIIFGQNLLVNFSIFVANIKNGTNKVDDKKQQIAQYLVPPILDSVNEATNSAEITITGSYPSFEKVQIRLYVNNKIDDVVNTTSTNSFTFQKVKLKDGINNITAVAVKDSLKSNESEKITVNYLKNPPELTVSEPSENASYSGENNTVKIKGKTGQNVNVYINDHLALMKSDGSFSFSLVLKNGDNNLKITAVDQAGNKTEKDIKVTYSS